MCPDLRLYENIEHKLAPEPAVDPGTIINPVQEDGVALRDLSSANSDAKVARADQDEPGTAGFVAAVLGADPSSDAALAQLALSALGRHAVLPGGKIRPLVRNAWLILDGEVEARSQKQAAEEAVKGLPGIRGVSNNILIESEVMAQRISQKIDDAFVRAARLSASRISVTANNQKVILSGSVHSGMEREQAEAAAWAVPGVAHVVNQIRAIE